MRTLTKIAVPALVALTALGAAGTASAQPYPGRDWGHHTPARAEAIRDQLAQLEQRVSRNDYRDRISEREAAGLRREVRDIRDQFRFFNRNGLDNREFRILQDRIDHAKARLRFERHDRDGRRW